MGTKLNLASRILFALLTAYCCIYLQSISGSNIKYFWFSVAVLCFLTLFGKNIFFALTNLMLGLIFVSELHLIRVYGFSFEYVYQQILSVCLDSNTSEIYSYLKIISYFEYFICTSFLVVFIISLFTKPIFELKFRWYKPKIAWIVSLIAFIVFLFCGFPKTYYKIAKLYSASFSNPLRAQNIIKKKNFVWNAKTTEKSPSNVVLVIGESHRRDFFYEAWDLLEPLPNHIAFSDMISQYPNTLRAIPQIISRKPFEYPVDEFPESSLLTLFKEAGYKTHYICFIPVNWQGDNGINYFVSETENFYSYGNINSLAKFNTNDADVQPILTNILNNEEKNFVLIKLMGVHYNFEDRYPKEFDVIQPSNYSGEINEYNKKNRPIFINTYKNAMSYSTSVIHKLLGTIDDMKTPALSFFISDHGMNIFDDGNWNSGTCKKAYEIPFIIKANSAFIDMVNKNKWDNLLLHKDEKLISNDVFETLVSLSDIKIDSKVNYDLTDTKLLNREKRQVKMTNQQIANFEDLQ